MERPVHESGSADAMVAVAVESFGSRMSEFRVPFPAQLLGGEVPLPPPVPLPPVDPVVNIQKSRV